MNPGPVLSQHTRSTQLLPLHVHPPVFTSFSIYGTPAVTLLMTASSVIVLRPFQFGQHSPSLARMRVDVRINPVTTVTVSRASPVLASTGDGYSL
jgi:hypothetical protein